MYVSKFAVAIRTFSSKVQNIFAPPQKKSRQRIRAAISPLALHVRIFSRQLTAPLLRSVRFPYTQVYTVRTIHHRADRNGEGEEGKEMTLSIQLTQTCCRRSLSSQVPKSFLSLSLLELPDDDQHLLQFSPGVYPKDGASNSRMWYIASSCHCYGWLDAD